MSGFDYSASAATALRLIQKFGQTVTLTRSEAGEPEKPWAPSADETTTTDYTASGVVTEYAQRLIDGVSVKYGDKMVIVAAQGLEITPSPNDVLTVNGQSFSVISVGVVSPAGVPLVYNVQARI